MARTRTIKPEFWDDEKLSNCSRDARLIFIGLWNNSDDYGVVKGSHLWLRNKILPYDNVNQKLFSKWLHELESGKFIIPFDKSGEKFYFIKSFLKYQKIDRPSKARNPEPPKNILDEYSACAQGILVAETETETETEIETEIETETNVLFENFWDLYDKKRGDKIKLEKLWHKLTDEEREKIMLYIPKYKLSQPDKKYRKDPQTFLNNKSWKDEIIEQGNNNNINRITNGVKPIGEHNVQYL